MFQRNLLSKIPKFHFSTKLDYLGISHFTPELKELRTTIRKFCDEVVSPLAVKTDKTDKFPMHLWKEMGNLGLLGITCPSKLMFLGNFIIKCYIAEYGGLGLNYTAHCMASEELSRVSASIGLSYGAHSALCLAQIVRHGSEEKKKKYLPKVKFFFILTPLIVYVEFEKKFF